MRPDLGLASDLHNGGNGRYCPVDEVHVPMVQVPDDWELIAASWLTFLFDVDAGSSSVIVDRLAIVDRFAIVDRIVIVDRPVIVNRTEDLSEENRNICKEIGNLLNRLDIPSKI